MNSVLTIIVMVAVLSGCVTTPPANPITSIKLNFPDATKWTQITKKSGANQYIREWVPEGTTSTSTKWIIVEQKITPNTPVSAESYIKSIFSLAKNACTDVLYNGPKRIEVNGHETVVGRFMCAQQKGKNYGTFTDQRIAAQGTEVYIVTSELRIPSSPKAGILSFKKEQLTEMKVFMKQQGLSAKFVRSVKICTAGMASC